MAARWLKVLAAAPLMLSVLSATPARALVPYVVVPSEQNLEGAGLGIAHLPDFVAGPSLAAGRTRALLSDYTEAPGGIFALYPPGRHLAAKVRVLVDFLAARYHTPDWTI